MPVLDLLPTLLQKPVNLLQNLPCVAGVISGKQQGFSTSFLIIFDEKFQMDDKRVLKCFDQPGLTLTGFSKLCDSKLMKITVKKSKQFIN
ncbi:hypothetical protein AMR72_16440 [Flavobacterium psychrophilum]|nr:hypothetical protein AMR72_16440 [Flavobacterium psychrophilum]AOE53953.1 hypothetical protein ALW18_16430 [Flavobacterium psychrophilum]